MSPLPRKRFGQNFLKDPLLAHELIDHIHLTEDDLVIEIGPGRGVMTQRLCELSKTVEAIEIDRDLVAGLDGKYGLVAGKNLFSMDVLDFDFSKRAALHQSKVRIVGNLPYNISTPLLMHIMQHVAVVQDVYVLLQREVAERLVAKVGCADYGRLSVVMQNAFHIECLQMLAPDDFYPAPKVWSMWVSMQPRLEGLKPDDAAYDTFIQLLRLAFSQRRKKCRSSLRPMVSLAQFERVGISPDMRAQDLTLQDYINLACSIS